MLRRVLQAYLTAAQTAEGVVAGADLNWADAERVGFALTNLVDALAPSNSPVLNPAALKAAIDTGGGSTLAGLRHFISDMAAPPRVPSVVEPDASEVGADLAVTPGASLIDRDSYLVAGITDHICPWQSCYRSTQLLGGNKRFVLSTSGHIAAMVNPPGNEKARYQVAKDCPEDPQEWLRHAESCRGSWWPDYVAWLAERCGEETVAPDELGGGGLAPLCGAPGTYVYDR